MEKQKLIQKKWYERSSPSEKKGIVQISIQTHIQRLKDLLPIQKVGLSLNCGCGRGDQNNIFGPSIGIDISLENIRSLREAGGQGVVADMESLPFRENIFDIIYGFGILHHLNDMEKGVSEATRVLKRGGHMGFGSENNGWCPLNYVMPFIYRNWKIEKGFYRIREEELRKMFRGLGIREFKISKHGMTIYGMGRVIYKLTSLGELFLSKFKPLMTFSGYCYIAGRKLP